MRIHRIVAGLITLVMLALLPAAAGSPALAADGGASAAEVTTAGAAPAAPAAAKATRRITIRGKEPRPNKFFVLGKVGPDDYQTKVITVQRKLASSRNWKLYKRVKTNTNSAYRVGVAALKRKGKVEYRTVTPPTKRYKAAASNGKIVITTY